MHTMKEVTSYARLTFEAGTGKPYSDSSIGYFVNAAEPVDIPAYTYKTTATNGAGMVVDLYARSDSPRPFATFSRVLSVEIIGFDDPRFDYTGTDYSNKENS